MKAIARTTTIIREKLAKPAVASTPARRRNNEGPMSPIVAGAKTPLNMLILASGKSTRRTAPHAAAARDTAAGSP